MVKMAPITEYDIVRMLPEPESLRNGKKTNGMKKCTTGTANHNKGWQLNLLLKVNFNKQWNTIIRSYFVYMSMGN